MEEAKEGIGAGPAVWTYKSNQRFSKVPSCTLDITYLRKLFEILNNINKEALQIELSNVEKFYMQSQSKPSNEDMEKIKKGVSEAFRIHVEIYGAKGEFLSSDSPSILKEEVLPDTVNSIKVDNSFFFKVRFNGRLPQSQINLKLDFSKPPVVDFITNPSLATTNNSFLQVIGENETWVEGSHQKILTSLTGMSNRRAWLHGKNVYDLFLWILIIPLSFWNLFKVDLMLSPHLSKISNVIVVAIYIYLFFIILAFFRFVFNYMRWLFPYLELKSLMRKGATFHRVIFVFIIAAVISGLIKDVFIYVIRYLF